jgi:transposase InsO family protein
MITAEKKPPAEPGTKSRLRHLNEHLFTSLRHARHLIAAWRDDYNHHRLHTSLDGLILRSSSTGQQRTKP